MLLELRQIKVSPRQQIILEDISWENFETILAELGERRRLRLAYDNGLLEMMMPSLEHEDDKEIIGDLIKDLLEELDIEFRCLGSATLKRATSYGLEPNQCFYIQNETRIRNKKCIDLITDPPPDLAIEVDINSRTHPSIYEVL